MRQEREMTILKSKTKKAVKIQTMSIGSFCKFTKSFIHNFYNMGMNFRTEL